MIIWGWRRRWGCAGIYGGGWGRWSQVGGWIFCWILLAFLLLIIFSRSTLCLRGLADLSNIWCILTQYVPTPKNYANLLWNWQKWLLWCPFGWIQCFWTTFALTCSVILLRCLIKYCWGRWLGAFSDLWELSSSLLFFGWRSCGSAAKEFFPFGLTQAQATQK